MRNKYRKIIIFIMLLGCFATFCGCSHTTKEPEKKQLSKQFYENLIMAFNGQNYSLVQTGLDKINEAGIADERTHYLGAMLALIEHDQERAIAELQAAIVFNPEYGDAHCTLGTIYIKQKKYDLAETELLQVCNNRLYPTPEKAYHYLGNLYREQGKTRQALGCYRKALQLNQEYFPSHYELSRLLTDENQLKLAAETIEKARQISPDHP
ncbi:tetratricopeptide repeat protein, partial [bacterium]|nr:tetratricopeptide repeat protein [bacterium]